MVIEVPSGNGMCTTGSGRRYSRPWARSPSSSRAIVGLDWSRVWAVEQESCR